MKLQRRGRGPRRPRHALGEMARENLNAAAHLADYLRPDKVADVEHLVSALEAVRQVLAGLVGLWSDLREVGRGQHARGPIELLGLGSLLHRG